MSEMLTDTELYAIRARAEAATPGPWRIVTDKDRQDSIYAVCAVKSMFIPFNGTNRKHDSSFCAHARTDIPALLEHIDEQRKEIEHLTRALKWLENRTLRVDDFAAPCQCEERHCENTECAFGEIPEQCCPKYNVLGTGTCWVQEALDATKEATGE